MLRAALYARFSTDMQSDASVEDQLRLCREFAAKLGAVVVAEFHDAGISGQTIAQRPGVQSLLAMVKARGCDVVIAEHTDRISRAGEDTWHIFKRLKAARVQYITVHQGEVTSLQVGVSGLLSELKLEEDGRRTRRGQEGVVLSGRACDSIAYGYRAVIAHDEAGERIPGLREIDPTEAEIVRRIFADYASGVSPYAICAALNAQGVPSPRGGHWHRTTLLGHPSRGLGMLRNEIYRGVRVWGRHTFVKLPGSGQRQMQEGIGTVQRVSVPDLRIVPEALWNRVQLKIAETALGPNGEGKGAKRPKRILSGLIKCGVCGANMIQVSGGTQLRCGARVAGGACDNPRTPSYRKIEASVLVGVEANLLHPLAIAEAVKAYNATLTAERKSSGGRKASLEREASDVEQRISRLVREVEQGMPWALVKDRHEELSRQLEGLRKALSETPADVIPLRPTGAAAYRDVLASLKDGLSEEDATEAKDAIRRLIEEIRFIPKEGRGAYELEVCADLAPVLGVNETGLTYMSGAESGSRFVTSHSLRVKFRLAG